MHKIPVTDALIVANVCKFVRRKRDEIRLYIVFRACGSLLCEITVQRPNYRAQRQRAGRALIFAGRDAVSRTERARERLLRGKTAVERDIKQPLFSVPNRGQRERRTARLHKIPQGSARQRVELVRNLRLRTVKQAG